MLHNVALLYIMFFSHLNVRFLFFLTRMIGHLSRTVTHARHHAEAAMINRYLTAFSNRFHRVESTVVNQSHNSAVPSGAVNSLTDPYVVHWPKLTKHNSTFICRQITQHIPERLIRPMLGRAFVDLHKGTPWAGWSIRRTCAKVQIGSWIYKSQITEGKRGTFKSRSSWFCIKAKNVPHFVETAAEDELIVAEDELLYGRLQWFCHLKVPLWPVDEYLGKCNLFRAEEARVEEESSGDEASSAAAATQNVTGEPIINIKAPLHWYPVLPENVPKNVKLVKADIEWVKLADIEGQLAVGPVYDGWRKDKHTKQQGPLRPAQSNQITRFHVMRLQK